MLTVATFDYGMKGDFQFLIYTTPYFQYRVGLTVKTAGLELCLSSITYLDELNNLSEPLFLACKIQSSFDLLLAECSGSYPPWTSVYFPRFCRTSILT